ncbi:MAG TPA: hypothetical protein VF493_05485, partial [Terriglobales bacterium]
GLRARDFFFYVQAIKRADRDTVLPFVIPSTRFWCEESAPLPPGVSLPMSLRAMTGTDPIPFTTR